MADEGKVADVRDLALPAVIAIAVPGAAFALMGVMPLMVFVVAFGGGFVLYMATLWRTPIDTTKILVPYLLTSAFFVVPVFEEYRLPRCGQSAKWPARVTRKLFDGGGVFHAGLFVCRRRTDPETLAGGCAFANPKGWAAMTALFSGFVLVAGNLTLNAALMVLILASIMVVTDVSWLLVGASLTRFFREPRLNRLINVSFAVLLVASVAVTLAF